MSLQPLAVAVTVGQDSIGRFTKKTQADTVRAMSMMPTTTRPGRFGWG
jgi:hypothetical protein